LIGAITFVVCVAGGMIDADPVANGSRAELAGGIILTAIGIKILLEVFSRPVSPALWTAIYAFCSLDFQHRDVDYIADREDLGRMSDEPVAYLGDVDKAPDGRRYPRKHRSR
jgi:hypothetical protein